MILEKQANDENAVDENGKLITQGQSVTQQEMVKIPEAKVDISMDKLRLRISDEPFLHSGQQYDGGCKSDQCRPAGRI